MKTAILTLATIAAVAIPAAAAEDKYIDDRSDAAALVRSLYNAVNRKEYGRAWDYFGDQKPAKSFDKFVQGYADTARVDVVTGGISEEGAAGSTYFQVAVAIKATSKKGDESVFAGCYTARLADPQIQETPFTPLHLDKGALKAASPGASLNDAVPASCDDGQTLPAGDPIRDQILAAFKTTYGASCQTLMPDAEPGEADPELHVLKYHYSYSPDSDEQEARLYKFNCGHGAYNSNEVYYLTDSVGGFRQLQFAEPELDIRFEDPDERTRLTSMTIVGYKATDQLVNSDYDETERSLTSFNKWRGIGDISSTGKWIFRDGDFALVHYEVDPTENGEIDGQPVLDFESAP
jgi:Protein of unknown function (DUF1176)